MKFGLIKERNTYYFRIFFLITFAVGFTLWLLEKNYIFITIPLFQIIPLVISPNYFYRIIGIIEFTEEKIIITSKEYENITHIFNSEVNITLFYDPQKSNDLNGFLFAKGFVVRIQIEDKGEFYEYKFLVRKKERKDFISVLENLYLNGINIREKDELGGKLFLLRGNYSYKEIQEIKSKFNINW